MFSRSENSQLLFFALPVMSLPLPQYTCREGFCTFWPQEVWLKDRRNFHSLACFVHPRTSLADVSLFSYMTLNTRNTMTKWRTHSFTEGLSESVLDNTHIQPLSRHPMVLYAVLTPTLSLKIRPCGLITLFFRHPTNTSQSAVHIPLLNSRATGHRALWRNPNNWNN